VSGIVGNVVNTVIDGISWQISMFLMKNLTSTKK
jgi:hypothetical protein